MDGNAQFSLFEDIRAVMVYSRIQLFCGHADILFFTLGARDEVNQIR